MAVAQPSAPAGTEEIIITAQVQGPPLWQVKNGDHTLWIFGYLSPLPAGLEFDPQQVDRVLARADAVLDYPDVDADLPGPLQAIGLWRQYRRLRLLPDEATLEDVLPADMHQRLLQLTQQYGINDKDFFRLRPLLAAARLNKLALKHAGLEDPQQIANSINRLVRRHHVPRTEMAVAVALDYDTIGDELNATPLAAEIACLSATLDSLEQDIDGMKTRARAWASGNVHGLGLSGLPDRNSICNEAPLQVAAMRDLPARQRALWLEQAQRALADNTTTFAQLGLQTLLAQGDDSLLQQLRAKGYQVIEPWNDGTNEGANQ